MRTGFLWAAALAALPGGAAMAQGWGLMAPTAECRALESLVVFGLVDGGEGGDTAEFSAVVESGDSGLCLEWLESYGYPGMWNPDCLAAFDYMNTYGAPDWAIDEVGELTALLAPFSPDYCANVLAELTSQ